MTALWREQQKLFCFSILRMSSTLDCWEATTVLPDRSKLKEEGCIGISWLWWGRPARTCPFTPCQEKKQTAREQDNKTVTHLQWPHYPQLSFTYQLSRILQNSAPVGDKPFKPSADGAHLAFQAIYILLDDVYQKNWNLLRWLGF